MFDITILWNYSPYIFSSDFISIRYYSLFFAIGVIFVYIKTTLKASSYLTPKKVDTLYSLYAFIFKSISLSLL